MIENFPRIPIGRWVDGLIDWINANLDWLLDLIKAIGNWIYDLVEGILLAPPALVMILVCALLSWVVRSWRLALGVIISFLLIVSMGQWMQSMQTLALVLVATLTAVVVSVPLGIWAARDDRVSAVVKPVMDFMQTMPAMVYLIPAITFFSIGAVPALFSTIIFAMPPAVRLTELGIRGVDKETVEAGQSFGATDMEILRGVQLPLAVPSIMAGINQVIMLALSMAVIAGMVGADGLGKEVTQALSTINVAQGAEAGLSLVFLAIFLDRLTAALGTPGQFKSSLLAQWKLRREKARKAQESAAAAA